MTDFSMTRHATRRAQQRAIRKVQIEQILLLSDTSSPVARHLNATRLSREALQEAVADGMPPAEASRLAGRTILLADDGAIVTLLHLRDSKARTYRQRDRRAYWKGEQA
jgi:hypothetical protein